MGKLIGSIATILLVGISACAQPGDNLPPVRAGGDSDNPRARDAPGPWAWRARLASARHARHARVRGCMDARVRGADGSRGRTGQSHPHDSRGTAGNGLRSR